MTPLEWPTPLCDCRERRAECEAGDSEGWRIPKRARVSVVLVSNDETIDGIDRTGVESHEHEVAS